MIACTNGVGAVRNLVLASAVILFAGLGWNAGVPAASDRLYSIQVRAVPLAKRADGMATYRVLRDKGYLVYAYRAEVDGKLWLRIAVGAFDSIDAAAAFGKLFSATEMPDYFVARAPVRVLAAAGGDFVVTPSALWTRAGGRAREVFIFDDPAPRKFVAPGQIELKPSPDRKAVAFQYGDRVHTVRLGDDKAIQLSAGGGDFSDEPIHGPTPYWSPSGRYVAFHDFLEFEVKTSLWVARANGGELRALVDNRPARSNNAVKAFVWHPADDRIFFVDGYARGSVSVGGAIRSVDMAGNIVTVLDNNRETRQEFAGPLRIEEGYLHYRRVRFNADYSERTIDNERMPLAAPGPALGARTLDSLPAGIQRKLDGNRASKDETDAALRQWYGETGFQPLWIGPNGVNGKALDFLQILKQAAREGLVPGDYGIAGIEAGMAASPLEGELLLSKALVHYVNDLRTGRLSSRAADPELFIQPGKIDRLAILRTARDAAKIGQAIDAYTPGNPIYRRLRRILAEYRMIAVNGGWPTVPEGTGLKSGLRDSRVTMLRQRLMATNDLLDGGGETSLYDKTLLQAVERFQQRHGLAADGVVGPGTLAELNVPVQRRIEQIIVNMERWRWMPNDLGDRYILVNLAGYELELVERDAAVMSMRIITGQPYRRTPVFSGSMTYMEFNPTWTVPRTIAKHDILPRLRRDSGYLASQNIRVFDGWAKDSAELAPSAIDWNTVDEKRIPYRFRQDPGPGNALGRVKFMFPNRFNVYLHDTPTRQLFNKTVRSFSSGCVRVEDPLRLAEYLTSDLPGWDRRRIENVIATGNTTVVKLARPMPVHLTYSTVWFGEDGTIHFRDDVYARDDLLYQALFGYPPSRERPPQDR